MVQLTSAKKSASRRSRRRHRVTLASAGLIGCRREAGSLHSKRAPMTTSWKDIKARKRSLTECAHPGGMLRWRSAGTVRGRLQVCVPEPEFSGQQWRGMDGMAGNSGAEAPEPTVKTDILAARQGLWASGRERKVGRNRRTQHSLICVFAKNFICDACPIPQGTGCSECLSKSSFFNRLWSSLRLIAPSLALPLQPPDSAVLVLLQAPMTFSLRLRPVGLRRLPREGASLRSVEDEAVLLIQQFRLILTCIDL